MRCDTLEQRLMPKMDAIERPDRDDAAAPMLA
jgi:hypothetical protein